jgi:stage IV sporulation protein FB
MLVEPGQTNFDLRFRLFGTPVRVHPLFWLFSAILGWDFVTILGFPYLLLWVATCFVSVLLHEFGHVWMGKAFGARASHIVLYSFGGLAVGSNDLWNRWHRVAVSLAGPGIQLALYGVLKLVLWWVAPEQLARLPFWGMIGLIMLIDINLNWALFNLLPVWPLDGGMVSREVCTWRSPQGGLRFSLGLSIAVAGFIAVHALIARARPDQAFPYLPTGTWVAILFGVLAIQSWQLLQQARVFQTPVDDRLPWESDPDAWKRR